MNSEAKQVNQNKNTRYSYMYIHATFHINVDVWAITKLYDSSSRRMLYKLYHKMTHKYAYYDILSLPGYTIMSIYTYCCM